jgi:hypothetical protein
MKLEVGKKYKTRFGMSAFVFSVSGREQEAIGYIELLNNEGHVSAEWFNDGTFFKDKREAGSDIVAEWSDKPDPGEGWRLLEPDEDVESGDQYYLRFSDPFENWATVKRSDLKQTPGMYYRRRIAPQYVPYTWDDREELRDRWFKQKGDVPYERKVCNIEVEKSELFIDGWEAKEFLQKCFWLDGLPCGKKVV